MSNIHYHLYRVQTVNNSFLDLGFEMGTIRNYVDLCSYISELGKRIKGKFRFALFSTASVEQQGSSSQKELRRSASPFCQIVSFCISQSSRHQLGQWHSLEAGTSPFIWSQLQRCSALLKKPYMPNVPGGSTLQSYPMKLTPLFGRNLRE